MPTGSVTPVGGGAAFNGGTITQPLTISDAIAGNLLHIVGPHTDLVVDGSGDVLLTSSAGGQLSLAATGVGNDMSLSTQNAAGDGLTASTNSGILMYAAGTQILNCNPSSNLVLFGGAVAAPTSGNLDPSTFALWLDPTPGATVLNIKAKDSGGTVRSATIPLT